VPEEVAILGIGNDTFLCENQTVPISSVVHDAEGTGYEGAALLGKLMNGGKAPSANILIPPKGVVARPTRISSPSGTRC
jgi:LacI family transcriptional regulator